MDCFEYLDELALRAEVDFANPLSQWPATAVKKGGRFDRGRLTMPRTTLMPIVTTGHCRLQIFSCALLLAAAAALAGCQTTSTASPAVAAAPSPTLRAARHQPKPPMTHTQAALDCWMATEHGHADMPLDKRADVVDKCIQEKMNGTASGPRN